MMAKMDLKEIMSTLPSRLATHSPRNAEYAEMKAAARRQIEKLFDKPDELARFLPPFGLLQFPYFKMGATDSISLFDLDELIIFSFYWTNRHRYRRVLDIGANIGLHSIVLSKCGFEVQAYEPDPKHFEILEKNLAINGCTEVTAFNRAVSNNAGTAEFVRVLGNTTGSHIAGSKPSPSGAVPRPNGKHQASDRLARPHQDGRGGARKGTAAGNDARHLATPRCSCGDWQRS
jgi:hypothetical protein